MGDPLGFDDMPDQTPEPLAGPQLMCRDNRPYVSRTLIEKKERKKRKEDQGTCKGKFPRHGREGLSWAGWLGVHSPLSLSLSKKNGGEVDVSKKKKDLEKKQHPLEIGQNRQREVVVVLAV